MDITSKDNIRNAILKDLFAIHDRSLEMSKNLKENVEDTLMYFRELVTQLSQPTCDPLVTKTPKIIRKRGLQRIETIPENDVLQRESTAANSAQTTEEEKEAMAGRRSKRIASQKAVDNIKKQNSVTLHTKLRRPIDESNAVSVTKDKNENQNKRKKSMTSSSDDDDKRKGSKLSKLDENLMEKEEPASEVKSSKKPEQTTLLNKEMKEQNIPSELQRLNRSASKVSQNDKAKKIDDTIVTPNTDDTEEPSMYEDAIGKPTPIMNSTMKHSHSLSGRRLNATVVLERLSERKLNETIVIQKAQSQRNSRETRENANLKGALQDSTHQYKEALQDNMYNELITDDESSPEIKKLRKQITKKKRRVVSISSDDEVPNTPGRTYFKEPAVKTEAKIVYKSNALFSPYAKESVKKRVEAFEQAVMHSPKSVDTDVPTRITRTKTRAMAAAETDVANAEVKNSDKNVTQILARKSLAKAKKIAYLMEKHKKDTEDYKEVKVSVNKEQLPERISKLLSNDKPNAKQYLKLTPLGKTKILPPTSTSRLQTPSNMQNLNYPKVLTASRANIITTVDSFIQVPKSITKTNSLEKLEDKKRHEEDVRKKRDEALRLQTEEKRRKRQEKELKNKLAREAKEKQELEKRQKAEKEKEEKARLAQLIQEKQREEMEKKRLAQLQRAQEKEERRKLEEQQRLQKLQEQEEAERLLAEQRRREQEAEKRREAEARAQQQAAAEALRQKNQMAVAQAKYKYANNVKHQGATNYILDSEPDEDESDDESKPKHEIPDWAHVHVRKPYLAMQRHVPEEIIFKFFDTRKCTPDLTELFHGIDRKRLKRTSSAIWKTPPRFSMMESE